MQQLLNKIDITKKLTLIVLLLSSLFHSCKQQESKKPNKLPYDITKLSSATELNLIGTNLRGFQDQDGIVYLVGNDLQVLTAYQDGMPKWKANVISACGKPDVVSAEIRYIKLDTNIIHVVFGKHSFAKVQKLDGTVVCVGSD